MAARRKAGEKLGVTREARNKERITHQSPPQSKKKVGKRGITPHVVWDGCCELFVSKYGP